MNKAKEKWSNPLFLEQMRHILERFTQKAVEMANLDLSGIELDCKSSVIQLRKAYLYQSKLENINRTLRNLIFKEQNWLSTQMILFLKIVVFQKQK